MTKPMSEDEMLDVMRFTHEYPDWRGLPYETVAKSYAFAFWRVALAAKRCADEIRKAFGWSMSGGHWDYLQSKFNDQAVAMESTLRLLGQIEYELDWGISSDTCKACADRRVIAALEEYFNTQGLYCETAIAILRYRAANLCDQHDQPVARRHLAEAMDAERCGDRHPTARHACDRAVGHAGWHTAGGIQWPTKGPANEPQLVDVETPACGAKSPHEPPNLPYLCARPVGHPGVHLGAGYQWQ